MKFLRNGIEISDADVKCLSNDILNIEDWINGAIRGKISKCKKRLIREWQPRLLLDPDVQTIPAEETALIDYVTSRKDYKNRETRDREDIQNLGEYFDSPEYAESLETDSVEHTD